jgi:TPR repeat protein
MNIVGALKDLFAGNVSEPNAKDLEQKGLDYYREGVEGAQEALELLARAAEMGKPNAMYVCSVLLDENSNDVGITKNQRLSKALLVEAANRQHYWAQYTLGIGYATGLRHVEKDLIQSYKWLTLINSESAKKYRNAIEGKMTSAQIVEAQDLASAWKPKTGALSDDIVQGLRQIYKPTLPTAKPEGMNLK